MTRLYLALPASGKSTFAKREGREKVVDLDIPGSRYIADEPAFKRAVATIAVTALHTDRDVVTHYNYLDLETVLRGAENFHIDLEIVCVLPHESMIAAQGDRILARSSSDNKFLEDATAKWESWVCNAYAEAQRLVKTARHYKHVKVSAEFLTPDHPFLGQDLNPDRAQSYREAIRKGQEAREEEAELEALLFAPDGHMSDHEVAVLVHRYQIAKQSRANAAVEAARAFATMSVNERHQALETPSTEVKE